MRAATYSLDKTTGKPDYATDSAASGTAWATGTFGGGSKSFEQKATAGEWQGQTLGDQAKARGYSIATDRSGLDGVGKADQDAPVLGLFAEGNMPVRWDGQKATSDAFGVDRNKKATAGK